MSGGDGRTVLVVLHGETVGGASLSILRVIPLLESRGWRFVFWAPRPSPLFDELERRGLRARGEPAPFIGYSLAALRSNPGARRRLGRARRYYGGLRRLIAEADPAVVHVNSLYAMPEGVIARLERRRVVMHVHEIPPAGWKGRGARAVAHRVAAVVAGVSEAGAVALSSPRAPAEVIFEGAPDLPAPPERSAEGATLVGTIGVLSPRKGTDVFLEAARIVRGQTEDVAFRLVGGLDNPLDREWAQELIAALPPGVEHVAHADAQAELAALDIFAMPSRSDPFPLVVLEAMASGLAVVGSRVDGIAEQLTPDTGVLVPAGDPQALATAILELHRDPERRRRLGSAARARALGTFSLERQAQALERAYDAATGLPVLPAASARSASSRIDA